MKRFFDHISKSLATLGETLEGICCLMFWAVLGIITFSMIINVTFHKDSLTIESYRAMIFLAIVFNIMIIAFFGIKIYTLTDRSVVNVISFEDIKKDNKLITNLSLQEANTLLSYCIKEEEYLLARLFSNHINKLNGKVSIN